MMKNSKSNFHHDYLAKRRFSSRHIQPISSAGQARRFHIGEHIFRTGRPLFIVLLLTYVFGVNALAQAASPQDTFRMANEAMRSGAVQDAIQLYQELADRNYASLELFYNLGTAYAMHKDLAGARLYLERAHLLDPRNDEVQSNLVLVKEQIDDVYHYPSYPFFGSIETVHSLLGKNFFSLCLLLMLGALAVILWRRGSHGAKLNVYLYMVLAGIILIVMVMLVELTYTGFHKRMAIVYPNTAPLFERPESIDEPALELSSGYKVRINEEVGPWLKIDLADGTPGWIERKYVEKIIN